MAEAIDSLFPTLKTTEWLAKRLNLSVSTIERLRAAKDFEQIPDHICLGGSIRYCESYVEKWIQKRLPDVLESHQNQEA